jgi:hypothetical protein
MRPAVRNHKKRESLARRHPNTIFDNIDLKNKTFTAFQTPLIAKPDLLSGKSGRNQKADYSGRNQRADFILTY